MRNINYIILHSTATKASQDIGVDEVRQWHLARGWQDIGYHYLVRRNGSIERGRPIEQVGAHVRGHNDDSIGVVYVGGLGDDGTPEDTRTSAQRIVLRLLLGWLRLRHNAELKGHKECDTANTACPSFDVEEYRKKTKYDKGLVLGLLATVFYLLMKVIK